MAAAGGLRRLTTSVAFLLSLTDSLVVLKLTSWVASVTVATFPSCPVPSLSWYVNESSPAKVPFGLYVKLPSGFRETVPCRRVRHELGRVRLPLSLASSASRPVLVVTVSVLPASAAYTSLRANAPAVAIVVASAAGRFASTLPTLSVATA